MTKRLETICIRVGAVALVSAWVGFVRAADIVPSVAGGVYTFNVEEGDSATYAAVLPADCTKVVKTGAGTLTMSGNSVDYHGNVEIQAGIVIATHMNALGRSSGGAMTAGLNTISVWKDAQLRATFATDKTHPRRNNRQCTHADADRFHSFCHGLPFLLH